MLRDAYYIFLITIILISSNTTTAEKVSINEKIEKHAEQLIKDNAFLSPVNAVGDITQFVAQIDEDHLCGFTQGRLKIFEKDNINNVTDFYWTPYRSMRVFEYYNGYIYLPQQGEGISIFDVRDPYKIRFIKNLDIKAYSYSNVIISDDMLFAADTKDNFLIILSLENPEDPQVIEQYEVNGISVCCKLFESDNKIYILGYDGFAIVDTQDVSEPRLLGTAKIESEKNLGALIAYEQYVYVFVNGELLIFDASNPQEIRQVSSVKATICYYAIFKYEHIFAFYPGGVHIYDISNPLKPEEVRSHPCYIPTDLLFGKEENYIVDENGKASELTGLPFFAGESKKTGLRADNIIHKDNYAYVSTSKGLIVFDISKPSIPKQIAFLKNALADRSNLIIENNYLYTRAGIIDISNPAEPSIVQNFYFPVDSIAIKDNYLFVVKYNHQDETSSIEIWNIENPKNAAFYKAIPFEKRIKIILIYNKVIYVGFANGKLQSCRLENDLTLTELDQIQLTVTEKNSIVSLYREGDLLYAATGSDGILSVDITNPDDLQVYARFNTSQFSEQIKVVDSFAYVADGSGGTIIVDMAEKDFEKKIAEYKTTDWTRAIEPIDNYIYTCEGNNGLMIYVSNLSALK